MVELAEGVKRRVCEAVPAFEVQLDDGGLQPEMKASQQDMQIRLCDKQRTLGTCGRTTMANSAQSLQLPFIGGVGSTATSSCMVEGTVGAVLCQLSSLPQWAVLR